MKRRVFFISLFLLLALLALLIFKQHQNEISVWGKKGSNENSLTHDSSLRRKTIGSQTAPAETNRSVKTSFATALEMRNVPIQFWGKVADQDGVPLENVLVRLSIRKEFAIGFDSVNTHFVQIERTTGKDGRFDILDERGGVLTIEDLVKDGYISGQNIRKNFGFDTSAPYQPNMGSPYVFQMFALDKVPVLFRTNLFSGVKPDGRVYSVSLRQGRKTEGVDPSADFKIALRRGTTQADNQFDWEFSIESINGGMLPTNEPIEASAPQDGYQPEYSQTIMHDAADWVSVVRRKNFFIFNGREFGLLRLEVRADYNGDAVFDLRTQLNISGTRLVDDGKRFF